MVELGVESGGTRVENCGQKRGPVVLVVNPHLRIVQCSKDELLIKHGFRSHRSTLLRDENRTGLLAVVLRAFRVPNSLADLESAGVVPSCDMKEASALVEQLVSQQVLIEPHSSLPHVYLAMRYGVAGVETIKPAWVGVVGSGYLGCRIARELARIRVKKLTLLDDRTARREDAVYFECADHLVQDGAPFVRIAAGALEDVGYTNVEPIEGPMDDDRVLTQVFEQCNFVVLALERFSPSVLHLANRVAIATERRWMSVYFDGSEAVIGPIYAPGDTPCYNEFEVQNEACVSNQDDYHVYKDALMGVKNGSDDPDPVLPPYLAVASGWAVTGAIPFLATGKSFWLSGPCASTSNGRRSITRMFLNCRDARLARRCGLRTDILSFDPEAGRLPNGMLHEHAFVVVAAFPLLSLAGFGAAYILCSASHKTEPAAAVARHAIWIHLVLLTVPFGAAWSDGSRRGVLAEMGLRLPDVDGVGTVVSTVLVVLAAVGSGVVLYCAELLTVVVLRRRCSRVGKGGSSGKSRWRSRYVPAFWPYVSASFAVSGVEEFVWRGYLTVYFKECIGLGASWALVAASGMFGLHHAALGLRNCAAKTVHGLVWGMMFVVTGSLVPSTVSHMAFQYMVWRRLKDSANAFRHSRESGKAG